MATQIVRDVNRFTSDPEFKDGLITVSIIATRNSWQIELPWSADYVKHRACLEVTQMHADMVYSFSCYLSNRRYLQKFVRTSKKIECSTV